MPDFKRRMEICEQLASVGFQIATIRVNKDGLSGDWYRKKQTFYKYVQRRLNHELYRIFGNVEVSIDRYGTPEYQRSLRTYLERRLQAELFDPEIYIRVARDDDFIQASDIIVGSLRKAMEDYSVENERILEVLKPLWPVRINLPEEGHYVKPLPVEGGVVELDACLDEVVRYLEKNRNNLQDAKVCTLEYLFYSTVDGSNDYIFTQGILGWLVELGLDLSEEQFRNEVTAALRDEGLIIVGTRKGIKIPRTAEDFREYIEFSVNLALPVLKRLKKAITFVISRTPLTDVEKIMSKEMINILKNVDA